MYILEDRGYNIKYTEFEGTLEECQCIKAQLEEDQALDNDYLRNSDGVCFTYSIIEDLSSEYDHRWP